MGAGEKIGTRSNRQMWFSRPETRFPNNKHTRDVGMSKRVLPTATFSGSTISDPATNFSVFQVDDGLRDQANRSLRSEGHLDQATRVGQVDDELRDLGFRHA